ncbi:MAG: putative UBA/THIF-type binding protein, partial [Modestobacter sp.]|nr:putative UBA/THIF-type binding protein [Modestobacter sp.]
MTESPHPLLPPATPVLRVDGRTLQVGGVDGRSGLRVHPAGPDVGRLLGSLDGRRSERAV